MIKRRIIATKLSITKQGEIKFFQVKIPFDAKVIIGIETAMKLRTGPQVLPVPTLNSVVPSGGNSPVEDPFANSVASDFQFAIAPGGDAGGFKNSLVGELKLQGSDDSNVFYAANITDYSVKEGLDKVPSVNFIAENVYTHGYKRKLEQVLVDGNTTVLAGLYKDRMGEMLKQDISYDVFLYLWYEFEKPDSHDDQPCA